MKKYEKAEIYGENFDKNVDEILKKIDEIKSVIAGRNINFISFITKDEDIDKECLNELISELIGYIEERHNKYELKFNLENRKFFYDFFYLVVVYCLIACNYDDQIFESIIKLSKTIFKSSAEDESIFDILAMEVQKNYPEECEIYNFIEHYEMFNEKFDDCYDEDAFESDIRYSINTFLDLRKLSKYSSGDIKDTLRVLNVAIRKLELL